MSLLQLINQIEKPISQLAGTLVYRRHPRTIGCVCILSLATYLVSKKLYDAYRGPFSKLPGPFQGRFYRIRKSHLDSPFGTSYVKLCQLQDKYGYIMRMGPNAICVSDKSMIKQVLVQDDLQKAPVYNYLTTSGKYTLFSTQDKAFHKQRRHIISRAFSVKYLDSLEIIMNNVTRTFIERIDHDIENTRKIADGFGTIDIWTLMHALVLDIIGETAFGQSFHMLGPQAEQHFLPGMIYGRMKMIHYFVCDPVLGPLIKRLPVPGFAENRHRLQKFMREIVRKRVEGGKEARRNDILQILLDARHAENPDDRLVEEDVANETVMFLIAGSETSGNTAGFILIELLRNPDKLKLLRQEIDQVPFEEGQTLFRHAQVKRLPYLNAVINETMRLNWIGGFGLDRIADRDIVLGNNIHVPKGTYVYCNIRHAHMNPEYWPEPHLFKPERWLDGAKPPPETDAFYPFSGGSRNCIGKNFALQELRIAIATLVKLYDILPIQQEMQDALNLRQFITLQVEKKSFSVNMRRRGI